MRPVRSSGFGGFGGGGYYATRLALGIAGLSVVVALVARADGGVLLSNLLFTPAEVLRGKIWQPLTYALVYDIHRQGIFGFLISLYFLYMIGSQVEATLGSKRFLQFFLLAPVVGALATIPISFLFNPGFQYPGLWAALGAVTVLFAHHFGNQPIYLMFVLPVQGKTLVYVSFGILGLYAIIGGITAVFPALFAMLFSLGYAKGVLEPRKAWLRFKAKRIERQLKKRVSRFSVIDGERKDDDPPSRRSKGDGGPWVH